MSSAPIALLDLKPEQIKGFLDSFDHVFSDCDGVIWGPTPLPRVGEFFDLMKKHGKTVHFVSNNSIRSQDNYEKMFKAAKIENGFENLITPSIAIAEYLKAEKFEKKIFSVSCAETTKVLESCGYECKTGPDVAVDIYNTGFKYCEDDPEIGAVVFDSDLSVNLMKLHKAITYLKRPEVLFLSGATDRRVHSKSHGTLLGCVVFTDVVAEETKREPILLGKPSKVLGEFAMKRAGISDPSRVLFIGDMIDQDVGFGRTVGFKTLLVLTYLTTEDMLSHETRPDYYANSLESIVPILQ